MTDIPLFPLGTVLFPSGRLPLQIFERRYVDMISKCMREGAGFGVVWIRRGSEVWREDSGLNMARVDIEPFPDVVEIPEEGRSMIDVLAGLQRHPEVRRLGLTVDTGSAWNICHVLTQLLPIDNSVKYELLGITDINVYVDELDELLSELSG